MRKTKYIHISDLHLIDRGHLYGINPISRFKKALESIKKHHSNSDFVVITGDLSDKGSVKSYEILKEAIDSFPIPIHLILGNHDNRSNFLKVFPEYENSNKFVQYLKEYDDRVFIFLDTLAKKNTGGKLCKKRFKWLKDRLKENSSKPLYIFMHHNPIESGMYLFDDGGWGLEKRDKFWELLEKYENIKHISFGHIHQEIMASENHITLNCTKATVHQIAYFTSLKEEYLTIAEDPAYAIIEMKKKSTRVSWHKFLKDEEIFQE